MKFLLTMCLCLMYNFAFAQDISIIEKEQYRNWYHVKSMVIYSKKHPLFNPFGGMHHVYVNSIGVKATKVCGKRKFEEGSVLAFILYSIKDENGAFVEEKKKLQAFMIKDKKYKNTDGWGYFAYVNGKNIVKDMRTDCHSCHSEVKNMDYVFSCWTK